MLVLEPCVLEEKIGKHSRLILIVSCTILPVYTSIEKIHSILDVFVFYSLCASNRKRPSEIAEHRLNTLLKRFDKLNLGEELRLNQTLKINPFEPREITKPWK